MFIYVIIVLVSWAVFMFVIAILVSSFLRTDGHGRHGSAGNDCQQQVHGTESISRRYKRVVLPCRDDPGIFSGLAGRG